MKVFICLKHHILAFDITDHIQRELSNSFPQWEVEGFHSFSQCTQRIGEPEILITWKFDGELYSKASNLKYIFTPAAGKDWVPRDPRGKVEVNYGTFHGPIMAESLLARLLHFNRRNHLMLQQQREHIWDRDLQSQTRLLKDQTVLIIGYGAIGRSCAKLLSTFGCRIMGLKRKVTQKVDELGVQCITRDSLHQALRDSDHVVLILPSHESTHGFIGKEELELMKETSYLYNMGRGNSLIIKDLIRALEDERIAGAALDVFPEEPLPEDSPLWNTKNLVISPHSVCICQNYRSEYMAELKYAMMNLFNE